MDHPLATWLLLPPLLLLTHALAVSFGGFVILASDKGEPVKWSRRIVSVYVREACARVLLMLISPLGWRREGRPQQNLLPDKATARSVPCLLVPGEGTNRMALSLLRTFLARRGWLWVWSINHRGSDKSLGERADDLADRVGELCRASGSSVVDIVAHGTGGLVAAWYLRHLDGASRVRNLVTLGTPWQGTRTAVFRTDRIGDQILVGRHLLDDLAPPAVLTTAIWSPDDPVVVPASNGLPATGATSVRIESAGHYELLISARAFRAVQAALQ